MSRELPKQCWLSALGLLVASVSLAQPYAPGYVPGGGGGYRAPYYGYGGYGYGGWGAGSTPAGSYLSGLGQAIRAQGQYNLMTSAAAINLEEADKKDIENQKLWTNTYFEMRKINQAYKDSQRGPMPTAEDWVRLAHEGVPERLNSSALDPVTGHVAWPSALQTDDFRKQREALDAMFADRAIMHGAIGVDSHTKIRATVEEMLANLKDHIRDIDTRYYLEARNFLSSLAREADSPTG
jgi:hypothetical protein